MPRNKPSKPTKQLVIPLVGALAALLSACASVGPNYQQPAANAPVQWQNQLPSPRQAGVNDASLATWWSQFNDPALNQLIDIALKNSPNMQTAQAKLRESRARRGLQALQDLPSVSADGSASRNSSRSDTSNTSNHKLSAALDASWEIDLFGGQRRALESADATLAASEADLNAARISLAAEVATTYISLRTDENRLAVARSNLASREQTLQLTQWRNEARLVSGLEINQAKSSVEQTRASVPSLQRSIEEDKLALALLLGLQRQDVDALTPAGKLPAVPNNIAVGIPADTLRQRPDVGAAERRLAAQTAQIGVATAARYPSLKLSGSVGIDALTLAGLLRADTITSNLVAGLTAPILDAGRITQNIEIQTAVQDQTLVAYRKAVNQALNDIEKALNAWARSSERLQILQVAADSAREAARLASIRFQAGQTDLLTQLDTQRTQLTQDDLLASAQGDRANALIQLYKALGGGWQTPAATAIPASQTKQSK